ncbi:ABC transporter substrate-binding protein [Siccirubricoccus sp. G192]|nr:ABC transporter substrate-binding protein [Siccirubricoccus sp. G192]
MAVGAPVTSIDPHFHNVGPNNTVASILFDSLLRMDERSRIGPGLAESWKPVEDGWEFKLRPGVRFHNGAELTADDVAFTLARLPDVPNSPGLFTAYTRQIQAVEIIGPLTLRLRTAGPAPLLPADVSQVAILNRATHAGATTEDFNSGRAAIGTGPYRLVSWRSGERLELERNEQHWGPRPHWQRVDYRLILNDASRVAALLAGDVEFIDQVPTGDIARLRRDQRLKLTEAASLRLVYLAFDHLRDTATPFATDNDGKPLARNPLKDRRVRQALSLAIDRKAIVERVMEGVAIPTGQFMPPGAFGYNPDIPVPAVDLESARRLLAEAGFPQGFRVTLHGPNDRYLNDSRIIQAVAQMWSRAGVRTAVEAAPYAPFISRASRQEFSAFLVSWGSSTGEPLTGLRATMGSYDRSRSLGAVNRSRYSNPAYDEVLQQASVTIEDAARDRLLQQATQLVMEDAAILPLHFQVNVWAMRRGLRHAGRVDERTRPQDISLE